MRRWLFLFALAAQLLGCLAPARAVIICLSDDGCVALEAAMPGATRCAEERCDEAHASSQHGCRDIPVIVDAMGLKAVPSTEAAAAVPVALGRTPLAPPWRAGGAGWRAHHAALAPPGSQRTVVLQL